MFRLFILLFIFIQSVYSLELTNEEKEYLNSKKVLKIHVEKDWEPYNYIENDEVKGLSNDLLRLITKDLPIKIDFMKGYTWDNCLDLLKNKELDIITNMTQNEDRKKEYLFTNKSFLTQKMSILSYQDYKKITQLQNKKVGIIKGFYLENMFKEKYPTLNVVTKNSTKELLEDLINKEVDAIVDDYAVLETNLSKLGLLNKLYNNILLEPDFEKPLYIATNKSDKILNDILNKSMANLNEDEISKLFKKYNLYYGKNLSKNGILTSEERKILADKNFNIYTSNWEPFFMFKEGSLRGISSEIWTLIVETSDIKSKIIQSKNFVESLNLIKEDKNGMILTTASTKEREDYAVFSKTVLSFPISIATNIKENFIMDLKELEGKKVAVGKNYSSHLLLKEYYPNIEFVPVKTTLEALDLLAKNEVYAAADILPVLIYTMNSYTFTNLKISGTSKFNIDFKFMLNKDNEDLVPIFNKLIDSIDDTTKQNILNKWIYTKQISEINYKYIFTILLISLFIILFILYRQKMLTIQKLLIEKEKFKYQSLMNMASDMIFVLDLDGKLLDYSRQVQIHLGYTNEEMKKLRVFDWDKNIDEYEYEQICKKLSSIPFNFQTIYTKKDKTVYDADISAAKIVIEDKNYIYVTVRDITKQKELEEQIRKEKDFISAIIDNSNAMMVVIDSSGVMFKVNKYAQEFTKYSQEEISSKPYFWTKFLVEDDKNEFLDLFNKAKRGEITKFFKNSWISKEGDKKIFEWSNTLVNKEDGSMDYLLSIGIDITDREIIQQKILEQKEEFETIFRHSKDGMAITDLNTHFIEFNNAYQEITGFSKEEMMSKSSLELSTPEHKEKMQEQIQIALEKGYVENYEKESIVGNGKRIFINMSITLLPDKKRFFIVIKDITTLKQIENQTRLVVMGEMIGNIAHQWRQPLSLITTIISGLCIKDDLGILDSNELKRNSEIIIKQADYLSNTIENFKNFIKEDKSINLFSIKNTIENAINIADASLQNNYINLILDIKSDLNILGNENELTEAFINILTNSKDALKENVDDDEDRFIFIKTTMLDENKIQIKFLDSAGGVKENILNRILEPYFTTKHQFQGTGLGLAIVDKIIRERHNGVIDIYNEEFEYNNKTYRGLCFSIILKN